MLVCVGFDNGGLGLVALDVCGCGFRSVLLAVWFVFSCGWFVVRFVFVVFGWLCL